MFKSLFRTRTKSEIADIIVGIAIAVMMVLIINPGYIFFHK